MQQKPQKKSEQREEAVARAESSLVLCNDEVNTFDHVIEALVKVCNHTPEQAEQCAYIVHYKGRCAIKVGSFYRLIPMKDALLELGLTVMIE